MTVSPPEIAVDPLSFDKSMNPDQVEIETLNVENLAQGTLAFEIEVVEVAGVPWLSVVPDAGTVEPGGDRDLAVTFDTAGLDVGTYNAQILIKSNDPANPEVTATVLLDVGLVGLSGTIRLQGRPAGEHDGTTVMFTEPETVTTETDENGNFSVVLTTGTYTVTATHRNYLPAENVVDLELPGGDSVGLAEPVVSGMLLVGDLNGDEIIDHYDLMLAASNQGETESQLQLQP